MIDVKIHDLHRRIAASRLKNQPELKDNGGEKKYHAGVLGEVIAHRWLEREEIPFVDCHGDRQKDILVNGISIDVKAKDRKVVPRPDYECGVPLYNHDYQRPEYYLFLSMLRDGNPREFKSYKRCFILGGISIDELDSIGTKWLEGQVSPNGARFWADCLVTDIESLIQPVEFLALLRG